MIASLSVVCNRAHLQWGCLIAALLITHDLPSGYAQLPADKPYNRGVNQSDWPQFGGSPGRNNAVEASDLPTEWDVDKGKNIKWSVPLGSESYGSVVVANGRVYVGTNNGNAYLPKFPKTIDLGVLLCFRESDGQFLWQYSCEKLPGGRNHDMPHQGICSSPVVEDDRLWFVTNRGEVVCLDTNASSEDGDHGPMKSIWSFDMMKELGVRQHNMATCSPTIWGDVLFICTSNGVDEGHTTIPAPQAPSFMAMDKRTGHVLWTDNSPGENILHGQWSSPTVGEFEGVPQVMFGGGDGWIYSFCADRWENQKPILLWKFDGNPKVSRFIPAGRATRNSFVAGPVVHDGLVYFAMGEDPEHGEGPGVLWCLDPKKRGDISAELVVDENGETVPHQRFQANSAPVQRVEVKSSDWKKLDQGEVPASLREALEKKGITVPESVSVATETRGCQWSFSTTTKGRERQFDVTARYDSIQHEERLLKATIEIVSNIVANPNSAAVWHYRSHDSNGNGAIEFEETMHRSIGSPTIRNGLLFIADFSGLVHCLDARTGKPHWTHDLFAACWTTSLIASDHVYVADEDGDLTIFAASADTEKSVNPKTNFPPLHEMNMGSSVYIMPVVANGVLYVATRSRLFAIANESTAD